MDPASMITAITAIVGAAISLYEVGFNITTGALADVVGKRNTKITRKIAELMAEDEKFRAEITAAYNKKNATLMQNILSTSPIGASYEQVRRQFGEADDEYAKGTKILADRSAKYQKIQQTSQDAYMRAAASAYNYNDANKMSLPLWDDLKELEANSAAKQASEGGLKYKQGKES